MKFRPVDKRRVEQDVGRRHVRWQGLKSRRLQHLCTHEQAKPLSSALDHHHITSQSWTAEKGLCLNTPTPPTSHNKRTAEIAASVAAADGASARGVVVDINKGAVAARVTAALEEGDTTAPSCVE